MTDPGQRIPLFRPVLREKAVAQVGEVLRSGWLGLGPRTEEFEVAFATRVSAPHCVAVSSCSAALRLALHTLDLPSGAEVVTTPLTFVGANQVILHEGLVPVFADVQPDTGNIDPASVEERITERTGAIMVLHYGGYPCDLDELYALSRRATVPIVEDCAHACGALYRGRPIGSHGERHAFSFQAVKNLPMGDGGALTVSDTGDLERLRKLRWFGIDTDTYARASGTKYRWDYAVEELGFKFHMNDIQAAIGLAQLECLDDDNARRRKLADGYRKGLSDLDGVELLREEGDRESSQHLFCILAERRDDLVDHLSARGIDTGVHYRPSYDYPMFEGEPLPEVERFWRRAVSLPMHLALAEGHVEAVVAAIREGW